MEQIHRSQKLGSSIIVHVDYELKFWLCVLYFSDIINKKCTMMKGCFYGHLFKRCEDGDSMEV